jgi:hypothetical protein
VMIVVRCGVGGCLGAKKWCGYFVFASGMLADNGTKRDAYDQ